MKLSNFIPGNYDLRKALLFCYYLKKNIAESHRMLVETYGEYALGNAQCLSSRFYKVFHKQRSNLLDV